MADLDQRINQLPRAQSSLNVADIGVVRSSAAATAGSEWGALAKAADAVGEQAARQNLTERQFNAQLEAASAGVTRDGSGNLVLPSFDTSTVEGRAGAAQALKNYEVQFRLDSEQRAKQMYAEAAQTGDIAGFAKNWSTYAEGTLGAVPKATRGLAGMILANIGKEYGGHLNIAKLESDNNLAKQALSVANTQLSHDLIALANIGQGDSDKAEGLMARYKENLDSLVTRQGMNSDQAKVNLENLVRDMGVQTFMGTVRDTWNRSFNAKVPLPKIREEIEGMIERFVTNPELKATVEQRNQMRVAAMTYIEIRTGTQNALNIDAERQDADRVTAVLNNYRIMEAEAVRVGDTEWLSSIRSGIHRELATAGTKTLGRVIEAMNNMDTQIKRLEDSQKKEFVEAFASSITLQMREAKLKNDPNMMTEVQTRLEEFLKQHGTPGNRQVIQNLMTIDQIIENFHKEARQREAEALQEDIKSSKTTHESWLRSMDGSAALRRFFIDSQNDTEHAQNMRQALLGGPIDETNVRLFENVVNLYNETTGENQTWGGLTSKIPEIDPKDSQTNDKRVNAANSIVEMLSKHIPGAIAAEKNKLAPIIHAALKTYNQENDTDLTIDALKRRVEMAVTPQQAVDFARDIVKMLQSHMDKATKLVDASLSIQNAVAGLGPPTQEEADFFVQHNWLGGDYAFATQNGKNAANFYNQIRRLPKIESDLFQLGASALPAATFRAIDLYNNLDFDLKASVPNQPFWEFMRINLQGENSQDPEAVRKVREIADNYYKFRDKNKPETLEQIINDAFKIDGSARAIMNKTAGDWHNKQRGLFETVSAFAGITSWYTETPPVSLELRNEIEQRVQNIMAGSPTGIEAAVEMATTQAIIKGKWSISTLSSPPKAVDGKFNKAPVWIKDSPEGGFFDNGFGGTNDRNRYIARIIDMSEKFRSRASSWPTFGQEVTETNRIVVMPAYGRGVDHSKGYAFSIYVVDDNKLAEQVTHKGLGVFYATRAASMYSAIQMASSKLSNDLVQEAENFSIRTNGKPMSREDREVWRGTARILAAGNTEAQSLALWASDQIRTMGPVRAWRWLDWTMRDLNNRFMPETVARILEMDIDRYGIGTDPNTQRRGIDPKRRELPVDRGVAGKTLPLPSPPGRIKLPEIDGSQDKPDGSVKPGDYMSGPSQWRQPRPDDMSEPSQ